MNDLQILHKWDQLSNDQRKRIIQSDGSMRMPQWAELVERMCQPSDKLTNLQVQSLLAQPYRRKIENAKVSS
jgi:hypothetical protein